MKKFVSILCLVGLLGVNGLVAPAANAFIMSYEGPDHSNINADSVVTYSIRSNYFAEDTIDAYNQGGNDVVIGKYDGDAIYLGLAYPFDGFGIDIGTSALGGSYQVDYWNGSSWESLISTKSHPMKNDDGSWVETWDAPSDWSRTSLYMNKTDTGGTGYTSSLYFVRVGIQSDYLAVTYADQVGLLVYNVTMSLDNELGTKISGEVDSLTFSSSSYDTTVYESEEESSGKYRYALYRPSSGSYTYNLKVPGYVSASGTLTVSNVGTSLSASVAFAQKLTGFNPYSGDQVTLDSAKAGSSNTKCVISSGKAYCAVSADEDNNETATAYADGYAPSSVTLSGRTSDSDSQKANSITMKYAYVLTVKNSSGNSISNATVEMGSSYQYSCKYIGSGQYGCVVPTAQTSGKVRVKASGYSTVEKILSSVRDDNADSQITSTITIGSGGGSSSDGVDYVVNSIDWESDGDLVFDVSNEGDEDTPSSKKIWIYVYVDGVKTWTKDYSQSSSDNFLDAGEGSIFNLGDDELGNEDSYKVKVCVDATNAMDEDNESNNCLTETVKQGSTSTSSNKPDLEVTDIFLEDDDLKFTVENSGSDDVSSGKSVKIYVYVDGDAKWSKTVAQSSSSTNFLDEGSETTYNVGNLLEDEGSSYTVKVCVDTTDTVDEESESNNCRTEDEDDLASRSSGTNGDCNFRDIGSHWSEEYVCNLFDRGIIDDNAYFYPNQDITRAEFLKMAMLDSGLSVSSKSSYSYRDVSSSSWYYKYVTYATYKGFVEGYSNGYFRPNDDISRGEALVVLMRIAGFEDYDFDESDIDFWDVDRWDWYAYAVVLADRYDIVDGYSNGSVGAESDISRAEAAKIIDKAYDEFYVD